MGPRNRASRWCAGVLLLALALARTGAVVAQSEPTPEYEVKAAYLLNFTRYVEWPQDAFEDDRSALEVCILGPDRFGEVIDRTMASRTSHGRPLRVSRIDQPDQALGCHVLFIGQKVDQRPKFLSSLRGQPILTVGESGRFLRNGGGVELIIVDETVQFGVNLDATDQAGLTVSSRMLHLARRVVGAAVANGGN